MCAADCMPCVKSRGIAGSRRFLWKKFRLQESAPACVRVAQALHRLHLHENFSAEKLAGCSLILADAALGTSMQRRPCPACAYCKTGSIVSGSIFHFHQDDVRAAPADVGVIAVAMRDDGTRHRLRRIDMKIADRTVQPGGGYDDQIGIGLHVERERSWRCRWRAAHGGGEVVVNQGGIFRGSSRWNAGTCLHAGTDLHTRSRGAPRRGGRRGEDARKAGQTQAVVAIGCVRGAANDLAAALVLQTVRPQARTARDGAGGRNPGRC